MLVTSSFSFSHIVFFSLSDTDSTIWAIYSLSSGIIFNFEASKNFVFNPFPLDKILDHIKLKAFADDKLNVTKLVISVLDKVENIVGKGEIACTSNFSFSSNAFKRLLSQTRQKVSLCGNGLIRANGTNKRLWHKSDDNILGLPKYCDQRRWYGQRLLNFIRLQRWLLS